MRKYLNTLRYGSDQTKIYLWTVIAFSVVTIGSVIAAIFTGSLTLLIFAGLGGIIDGVTLKSKKLTEVDFNEAQERRMEALREKFAREGMRDEGDDRDGTASFENADGSEEGGFGLKGDQRLASSDPGYEHFNSYTEQSLTRLLKKQHVGRVHRTIIIDEWRSRGISQMPAYIWKDRRYVYFLILLENPLKVRFPLEFYSKMGYKRGVLVDSKRDYACFEKTNSVTIVFKDHLPTTYTRRKDARIMTQKNLYRLGEDMFVTNSSVKNVIEILDPYFEIHDEVTEDKRHEAAFCTCYCYNTLWRDGAISAEEYKNRIGGLLTGMAKSELPFDDFRKALEQMTEYRFITDEYADKIVEFRKNAKKANKNT